jgi:hypothetical protein
MATIISHQTIASQTTHTSLLLSSALLTTNTLPLSPRLLLKSLLILSHLPLLSRTTPLPLPRLLLLLLSSTTTIALRSSTCLFSFVCFRLLVFSLVLLGRRGFGFLGGFGFLLRGAFFGFVL